MNNEQPAREQLFDYSALLDWKFTRFITVDLVKVLYLLGGALLAVAALGVAISGFTQSFGRGLLTLIAAPILFVIWLLVLRVYLELIVALFKIAQNTGELVRQARGDTASSSEPPPPAES